MSIAAEMHELEQERFFPLVGAAITVGERYAGGQIILASRGPVGKPSADRWFSRMRVRCRSA